MTRGDGDDGGSHDDDGGGGVDSAHAGMIFFRSRGSRPWLGEAWWRAALHYAGLLAVLQLQ